MVYVGMDIHKPFSEVAVVDQRGEVIRRRRLEHRSRKAMKLFFSELPAGSPLALKPMGPDSYRDGWPISSRGSLWMCDWLTR